VRHRQRQHQPSYAVRLRWRRLAAAGREQVTRHRVVRFMRQPFAINPDRLLAAAMHVQRNAPFFACTHIRIVMHDCFPEALHRLSHVADVVHVPATEHAHQLVRTPELRRLREKTGTLQVDPAVVRCARDRPPDRVTPGTESADPGAG